MKRILSLILVLVLSLTCLAACGTPETPPAAESYKLSIGVAVNFDGDALAKTVAAIVTDADGKVVLCRVDCVEYGGGEEEMTTAPTSKVEQGEDYDTIPNYGMDEGAGDWYKQGAAFEAYVVGKTQTDIAGLTLTEGKTDLIAGCTIDVTDMKAAVDKAFASEYKTAFSAKAGTLTAGLKVAASALEVDEEAMSVTASTTFAAVIMSEGKVAAAILDTAEPSIVTDQQTYASTLSYDGTKRELGTSYDSYKPMAAGTWYVQADAYAKAAIGLTKDNIATLASEGVAGCSIYAGGYKAAIEAAVNMAR